MPSRPWKRSLGCAKRRACSAFRCAAAVCAIYAAEAEALLADWERAWPFPEIKLLDHRWAEPDMEDVFTAYSQRYDAMLNPEALR